MKTLYVVAKKSWRRLVPQRVQEWAWSLNNPLRNPLIRLKLELEKRAGHDDVYDASYYEMVEDGIAASAGVMAATVYELFKPKSLVDVGCGTGRLLLEFPGRDVQCRGFEYSQAAIDWCRKRNLNVQQFDLESDSLGEEPPQTDLVISTEVAEHLPASVADRYVDFLVRFKGTVIITAATPGQGGTDHVNEQPHEYWIEKFKSRGYAIDREASRKLADGWREGGALGCYWRNVMVFTRA